MRQNFSLRPPLPLSASLVNFSHRHQRLPWAASPALAFGALLVGGCAPTVNLATPNPIKVDINVRLDVYEKTAPSKANDEQSSLKIAANRRLRAPEITQLKAQHVIGENRDGYLEIRVQPTDPKEQQRVEGIVSAENADRAFLYLANAQSQNRPLEAVEREYAQLWADRALPGEWVQKEDGTWIQK